MQKMFVGFPRDNSAVIHQRKGYVLKLKLLKSANWQNERGDGRPLYAAAQF